MPFVVWCTKYVHTLDNRSRTRDERRSWLRLTDWLCFVNRIIGSSASNRLQLILFVFLFLFLVCLLPSDGLHCFVFVFKFAAASLTIQCLYFGLKLGIQIQNVHECGNVHGTWTCVWCYKPKRYKNTRYKCALCVRMVRKRLTWLELRSNGRIKMFASFVLLWTVGNAIESYPLWSYSITNFWWPCIVHHSAS